MWHKSRHCIVRRSIGLTKCLVLFFKSSGSFKRFWWEWDQTPNGEDGAGEALLHTPVCVHLRRERSQVFQEVSPSWKQRAAQSRALIEEKSKMEETKPAHVKSSLSLALRNRPVGAPTWDEMRMLGGEPELPTGGNHSPGAGERRPQVWIPWSVWPQANS